MNESLFGSFWSTAWEGGNWGPPWKGAFEGLSAQQAAWKPERLDDETLSAVRRDRVHSIWQILNHIVFWREVVVAGLRGERPTDEETARRNWEEPGEATEAAWAEAKARYAESHRQIGAAMAQSEEHATKLADMLPHDAYHIGQVYTMRALLEA